jgi:hypothetical protein
MVRLIMATSSKPQPKKQPKKSVQIEIDDLELTARATVAYYSARRRAQGGGAIDAPGNTSGLRKIDGLPYIVLENVNGVLAVFRLRNDGILKSLRRWPAGLGE